MNIFISYIIFCSYSIIFSRVYGWKIHGGSSFNDQKAAPLSDKSKYKLKQILDIYSEDRNKNNPTQTKHLFKLNVNAPKEIQSNQDSENDPPRLNSGYSNKRNSLSMEVGKHLVKVTSALKSKHLELKPNEGGYEILVNPKFSHVIEILPMQENNLEKVHIPETSEESEIFGQKVGTGEKIETGNGHDYKESIETGNGHDYKESIETGNGHDYKESIENGNGHDYKESIENGNTPDSKETSETENTPYIETVHTKSTVDTEETTNTESTLNTEETTTTESVPVTEADIEPRSGSGNQSAFNEEFEGSGEDLFPTEDSVSDESSKSGRVLSFFARQNETAPNCTTPKGESGQCRRIRQCLLSDALNNFNVFLQHLCLIRGAMVGICCPNNPVIEISNDDNSTNSTSQIDIKQPPEGCGLNIKTRIVGGTVSVPHEWTWMVALLRRNRFYCGGVIINNWYILTAAHCVLGINVKDLTVRLGEYDFNTDNKHQEDITVSEIKRHAQFVTLTFQHDIALLKLKRSIQYSKFVGSICLPNQKARDYSDVNGTVVGWGTVSFGGAASAILRQVTVPVWKNKDCDRTYLLENISDSFMCAGSPEKGEDACQGDSGGPLMAANDKGRWEVIGLVSWGRRCGDPTYPGVYTRVTTYLDWINENAN